MVHRVLCSENTMYGNAKLIDSDVLHCYLDDIPS